MFDSPRLNVGCGEFYADGWVNVDLAADEHRHPDVIADVRSLPFDDGTIARVFCGHLLEHLPRGQVPRALRELARVLAPGGELLVVGPAIERATTDDERDGITLGACRWPHDAHRWVPTADRTLEVVRNVFPDAHPVDVQDIDGERWPITSRVGWQCAVLAAR